MRYCEIRALDIEDPLNNKFEMVEDNTDQDEWPHKVEQKIITYSVIQSSSDFKKHMFQTQAVNLAMTMWDIEIEPEMTPVDTNMMPFGRFSFLNSTQQPYFKDNPNVLARAWYPGQGDYSGRIEINDDFFFNLTGKQEMVNGVLTAGYNIIAILGHEIGHMLGLTHSKALGSFDLMLPYYNKHIVLPSLNDIRRVLIKYPEQVYKSIWHNSRLRAWMRTRILRYQIK